MIIKKHKGSIYENYHRWIRFFQENSFYAMKHQKKDLLLLATKLTDKIHNATNAKQNHQPYLKKKTQNW